MMFIPPVTKCPVCTEFVRLDKSQKDCARFYKCGKSEDECPLAKFFTKSSAKALSTEANPDIHKGKDCRA